MEKFYRQYKSQGLAVLGICSSGAMWETRDLVNEMDLTFTMAHDYDDVYSGRFGADTEPIIVLLDSKMKILEIDDDLYPSELRKSLKPLGVL